MTGFHQVGVVGAGLMGGGIAQVSAVAGYPTIVRDVNDEVLGRARRTIEQSLAKFVEKQKLTTEAAAAARTPMDRA
jgi:3-hydroxybutyryl-CoA dehydrogenase